MSKEREISPVEARLVDEVQRLAAALEMERADHELTRSAAEARQRDLERRYEALADLVDEKHLEMTSEEQHPLSCHREIVARVRVSEEVLMQSKDAILGVAEKTGELLLFLIFRKMLTGQWREYPRVSVPRDLRPSIMRELVKEVEGSAANPRPGGGS